MTEGGKAPGRADDARPGAFSLALLETVGRLGDGAIVRAVHRDLTDTLARDVSKPQLYATLGRLVAHGLLTCHEVGARPVRGGRRMARYETTARARELIARHPTHPATRNHP